MGILIRNSGTYVHHHYHKNMSPKHALGTNTLLYTVRKYLRFFRVDPRESCMFCVCCVPGGTHDE
jgi:hypothetical protein